MFEFSLRPQKRVPPAEEGKFVTDIFFILCAMSRVPPAPETTWVGENWAMSAPKWGHDCLHHMRAELRYGKIDRVFCVLKIYRKKRHGICGDGEMIGTTTKMSAAIRHGKCMRKKSVNGDKKIRVCPIRIHEKM